jgi:exopolysaccharide biosynthesis polyprenyl glycosylphosphotransferase
MQRGGVAAAFDGAGALALALLAALYGNTARIPTGHLQEFLATRITILNAAFGGSFMMAWMYCFRTLNLRRPDPVSLRSLAGIAKRCFTMAAVLWFYLLASQTKGPLFRIAAVFFAASFFYKALTVAGGHGLRVAILARDPQRVVILGSGRRAGKAWRQIRTRYYRTVHLLGFVDDRPTAEMAPDIAQRYLGSVDQLSGLLLSNVIDELLIAMPVKSCYPVVERAIATAEEVGVRVVYMQDVYASTRVLPVTDEPELFSELVPLPQGYLTRKTVKRLLDIVGAAIGLFILSPVFLLIAIAVKVTSQGTVFFVQDRYGHRRRLFPMYKFRSMVRNAPDLLAELEDQNEADGPIFKMRDDPRVTPLGRILRRTSLDELPQLLSVLLGDMSLVGPRPMTIRDVSRVNDAAQMRRFSVKPGITGLWQVSGRSDVGFDQWVKLDSRYIDDWSLALDIRILAKTLRVVLRRSGAV